ncbi:PTS sugar transporter subunit IIB [Lacticaseibacillus rhamnosus]|uniref:PTS sugar transporter subunit IIB n=1 Tax=Lacticaseibacillus rhamnosus TaxID=47715 RepID=UPI000404FBDF|nr:PTS sugar transporter subunit IIB [Lacticaseibacillus rhamnosus]
MNDVVNIRVDDRLIHGQVAGLWTNRLAATRIMVIDDEVANDNAQKELLRTVAPASVNTSIITEEKAFNNLSANRYAGQRVFVLVKSPLVLKRLFDRGLKIHTINLGNVSKRDDRRTILPGIALNDREREALYSLINQGVTVTAIKTPTDPRLIVTEKMLRGNE